MKYFHKTVTPPSQWANLGHHVVELDQYQYFHFLETSSQHFVTIIMVHQQGNIFVSTALHCGGGGGTTRLVFTKKSVFLRYTHITPLFWVRTDPTRWDHISLIS